MAFDIGNDEAIRTPQQLPRCWSGRSYEPGGFSLSAPRLPDWAPKTVADRLLGKQVTGDENLYLRLFTDERMRPVWDFVISEAKRISPDFVDVLIESFALNVHMAHGYATRLIHKFRTHKEEKERLAAIEKHAKALLELLDDFSHYRIRAYA